MPEGLKLSQIGSSLLPSPFKGLHSPGVRKHCQIIFTRYFRKSSIARCHSRNGTHQLRRFRENSHCNWYVRMIREEQKSETFRLQIKYLHNCICVSSRHLCLLYPLPVSASPCLCWGEMFTSRLPENCVLVEICEVSKSFSESETLFEEQRQLPGLRTWSTQLAKNMHNHHKWCQDS